MAPRLRVGVSACILHADPQRPLFKGKTLLYAEESMLRWVLSGGAVPVLLPRPTDFTGRAGGPALDHPPHFVTAADLVDEVDALLLQGGVDMSPESYGQTPAKPEWSGDGVRDAYETELIREAVRAGKPVLGVCRGAQVLNVAFGGSLCQDIATMHPHRRVHRDWEVYDALVHRISFEPDSWLSRWYPADSAGHPQVNSVHHQGLDRIGDGLVVEARSVPDGVVEAVRGQDPSRWVYGVQWHPEFMHDGGTEGLDPTVLRDVFLREAASRRDR